MILPDVVHSFYLNDTSDCEFQHIHLIRIYFQRLSLIMMGFFRSHCFMRCYSLPIFIIDCVRMRRFDEQIQKLIDLYTASESLFTAANVNVALMNLMLYILDHTEPVHEYKEPQLQNSYVAYALNYIHDHYTTKILQEDIAIQLQISVRYLSKIFKSYMGVTLSNYINIYRINCSIELMQNTNLTLTEIALQVGFKDSQHYSKVFMNVINETPSQYRKTVSK